MIRLSQEYRYAIGSGVKVPLPKIKIRYVIDNNKFGYANFGDFIMIETGDLYVWTKKKEFAIDHNQDMVEGFFEDECRGRGYLCRFLFAGVETPYKDSNGELIFTGDVIDVNEGNMKIAFGTLGENSEDPNDMQAIYCFALDNHYLPPEQCRKMTRIGTVFYQLDWNDDISLVQRCWDFQGCYPGGLPDEDKYVMAKYTPNFAKEIWKYHGLEDLGIEEYNWRK